MCLGQSDGAQGILERKDIDSYISSHQSNEGPCKWDYWLDMHIGRSTCQRLEAKDNRKSPLDSCSHRYFDERCMEVCTSVF